MNRRDFLKIGGLGAAAITIRGIGGAYGATGITEANIKEAYARLIPANKGLPADWIASLTSRGAPQAYTDPKALEHIGMPVGGLFAGTVYLGGDGRLWLWNIQNDDREGIEPRNVEYKGRHIRMRDGANYVAPACRRYPFEQNFAIRIGDTLRPLDSTGFKKVTFVGRYPMAEVTFEDPECPARVTLTAYSPFIPLNTPDSSLPVTIMSYRIENRTSSDIECEVIGWLENPVCRAQSKSRGDFRKNTIVQDANFSALNCTADLRGQKETRPEIVYENFDSDTYGSWTASGSAFGGGPVLVTELPSYQANIGAWGKRLVNSHASAPGTTSAQKDAATGTLTSPEFTVSRRLVNVLVGGGNHKGKTCVNLLVDGKVIDSVTGDNSNTMQWKSLAADSVQGKQAVLQVVDNETGAWGNIGIGGVVFSDHPHGWTEFGKLPDFGTMTLAVLNTKAGTPVVSSDKKDPSGPASTPGQVIGSVGQKVALNAGASETIDFLISWHFPNLTAGGMRDVGREYASRFDDALSVTRYVAANFPRLSSETSLWCDTWYDSTLPYWFLDRTMANTSILATTTAYRFRDGRFWAWEGIGCCPGTCTHVWHYAQAPARLFPDVERRQREEVDFGVGMHKDGGIGMRANLTGANHAADDGQCGRILGAYREHQMSEDDAFLKKNWANIKKAIQFMINRDGNLDGVLEGAQHNTLDAAWYGRISFLASLYLATLRAGEAMASEVGDTAFARQCKEIADKGSNTILELYNGEYFFHELAPAHIDNIAVGTGCYVDQVFGQFWAHQVGLGYLFDQEKIKSALIALYKYNFVPHIGHFRDTFTRGRWYANDNDKGLIMCSWPKGGLNKKWHDAWQFGYFNECMTGFEWQAAAHMISEGLVEEGMAVSRAIHDRYDAHLRNPYNEIECSDHYSRAMASYGAFLSACGYETHGPKGHLGFAPKISPASFKAPFTAAGAWGSYEQTIENNHLDATLAVKYGSLHLKTLSLELPHDRGCQSANVTLGDKSIPATFTTHGTRVSVSLEKAIDLTPDTPLRVEVS